MQFFDLNIPYQEGEKSVPDKSAKKQNRLRLIIKAMELGYTGIAYNRTIKGAMSESDRCSIPPFPLSSLINAAPSLSSAVSFHRRLLGVPANAPFRQYTRLTVSVDTTAQASALNSGNPVLKTYDLIAVRPLNQNCFDRACQSSQVDLISINFADKLPFRLKQPMVKAAIARGVYFEIAYSSLMEDVQARKQLISNAKLLVEWTKGKNLIISSAASSVLDLRGPNDVSNLSSLLGLSDERAKAAISKNCRLLIASALRKKQFYKEAIRVEVMPPGAQSGPKEPWVVDDLDWDPISSGEGDLCLADMAKSFANSGKVSQIVKAIDFDSMVHSAQLHGLHVKDIGFTTDYKPKPSGNSMDLISNNLVVAKGAEEMQTEPRRFHSNLWDQHDNAHEKYDQAVPIDSLKVSPVFGDPKISSSISLQELETPDGDKGDKPDDLERSTSAREVELQKDLASHAGNMLISNVRQTTVDDALDVGCTGISKAEESIKFEDADGSGGDFDSGKLISDVVNGTEARVSAGLTCGDHSDLSGSPDMSDLEDPEFHTKSNIHAGKMIDVGPSVKSNCSDVSVLVEEVTQEHGEGGEHGRNEFLSANTMMEVCSSSGREHSDDFMVAKSDTPEYVAVEAGNRVNESAATNNNSLVENKSGNHKVKRFASDQVYRFPFKRLLQVPFKKKGRKSTYKKKGK